MILATYRVRVIPGVALISPSDLKTVSDNSRRLVDDLQRFLNSVEPLVGRRPLPTGQWYSELQDACNQVHYLWTRLETLERLLGEENKADPP